MIGCRVQCEVGPWPHWSVYCPKLSK